MNTRRSRGFGFNNVRVSFLGRIYKHASLKNVKSTREVHPYLPNRMLPRPHSGLVDPHSCATWTGTRAPVAAARLKSPES
jgi:hypothetical protein